MPRHLACILVLAAGCAAEVAPTSAPGVAVAHPAFVHLQLTDLSVPANVVAPARSAGQPQRPSLQLAISRIELASSDGAWVVVSQEVQSFDVLAFADGAMLSLADTDVPAGIYRQLRVTLDSATFALGAVEQPLALASPAAVVDLDNVLAADTPYEIDLGFDAAASVWPAEQGYEMAPVIAVDAIIAQ